MIISRSIHVADGIAAFIFRAEYSSNVYMHHILIQSSAIVNSASVNTGILYDDLEGWDRVGGGREVQEGGDICIAVADS